MYVARIINITFKCQKNNNNLRYPSPFKKLKSN